MIRPLRDSEYLYGLHDPGGEHIMLERGIPGWVLVTEGIGFNPSDGGGGDYRLLSDRGLGVMVRLNAGYGGVGTIPAERNYADFARRCANFVRSSQGAHLWIIGNEMNHPIEWPGADWDWGASPPRPRSPDRAGEAITPQRYVKCFRMVRDAIKALPGRANDQVLPGAVAPWNNLTKYAGNEEGDWIKYHKDMLELLGPNGCDGITLHTYTHGSEPDLIDSPAKMGPPFQRYHYHFRTYQDFMHANPANMRHLPVYITETDQDVEWLNQNNSWVRRAYGEIDYWNRNNAQQIRSLILYRWQRHDKWYIDGKQGVIEDFRQAMDWKLKWRTEPIVVVPVEPVRYRAEITLTSVPARANAGSDITIVARVRNAGEEDWPHAGANPVRLGYKWFDSRGQQAAAADHRTVLPRTVRPGETVELRQKVGLPAAAGQYTLAVDLVHEGITWFGDRGSTQAKASLTVDAAALPAEEFFPQTNVWVRGVFLEFYRRHGLDICGYPLTEAFREHGMQVQYFQRVALEEHEAGKVRLRLAAQQALEAGRRIDELEARVAALQERLQSGGGAAPQPRITDISAQLPRDAGRMFSRPVTEIRHLVINHTAVAPTVTVERIAQAHRARWPAIVCQFYVDGNGNILQTNPVTEVVDNQQAWLRDAINIHVAGNFSQGIPTETQIDALAALCAWLLDTYNLETTAVQGAKEFTPTQSPGVEWQSGRRWKDLLVQRVESLRGSGAPAEPGTPAIVEELRQLLEEAQQQRDQMSSQLQQAQQQRDQLNSQLQQAQQGRDQLNAQLQQARQQVDRLSQQVMELEVGLQEREQLRRQVEQGRQQIEVLTRRVAELEAALQESGDGQVAQPPVQDVITSLPRDPARMFRRGDADIRFIVINHTAVPPTVGVERVAQAHRARWPAIVSQFFIDGDGNILQTNPLNEVVDNQQEWLFHGVNIHVAGNFSDAIPSQFQLDNLAHLCAWLMSSYNLPEESLKGVREFIVTQSPGNQWLAGQRWKDMLLERIRALRASAGPGVRPGPGDTAELEALRQQIAQLQRQNQELANQLKAAQDQLRTLPSSVQQLQAQVTELQRQKQALEGERAQRDQTIAQLRATVDQQQQRIMKLLAQIESEPLPSGPAVIAKPPMEVLVDALPKHPTARYDRRTLDKITHIAIHHSAAPASVTAERIATYHVTSASHQWPGIGYHYYIGPDGLINHTQDLQLASYHVYQNNSYSVGICVAGDFTTVIPTPAQLDATAHLAAWLMQELNIPLENVKGHKEFPLNATACPGRQWTDGQKWRAMLMERIQAAQGGATRGAAGAIDHYLLFWQHANAWAREDWLGAINYIDRFRPTTGFSVDDAKAARRVTIVGGAAGVSQQAEDTLRAAGVRVERIAGRDFAETKAILDNLAATGQRFLNQ